MRETIPVYVVPAEVPGWVYVVGHEGPGCYREVDLWAMGYEPHYQEAIGRPWPDGCGQVWYVGKFEGGAFSVSHPSLFPNDGFPGDLQKPYHPPRGLLALNSLQAATDWVQVNGLDWPEKIITMRRNGKVEAVIYHHQGDGEYGRKR